MKKISYLIICFFVIISCSKESPLHNSEDKIDVVHYPTGLIPLTDAEIAGIPSTDAIDNIVLSSLKKGLLENVSIEVPPPGNQGKISSCTAWAVGYGMLGYQYHIIRGYSDYDSPDKLFSPGYIYNQLSPDDKGINIRDAFDLILKEGCCTSDFMDISAKPNILPSNDAKINAANYKISAYYKFENFDIEKIKAYLVKGYPVVFACAVDSEFTKPKTTQAFEIQTDGRCLWKHYTNKIAGNHSMLICGYDNSINAFKILNSWGKEFGNSGFFWIDYDWFKKVVCKTPLFNYPEIFIGVVKRPILTTSEITGITLNSAKGGGKILSDWGFALTSSGICWNTKPDPVINNNQITSTVKLGDFQSNLNSLIPNTTYFVKAYATNSYGTAYGTQVSFTTSLTSNIPSVTTSAIASITQTSATCGGNISNDGGSPITSSGVCWSTTTNPTTTLPTKTSDGTGTGVFTSSLTGLTAGTTYYVRAYATNTIGIAYGTQVSFTTSSGNQIGTVTDIEGNTYNTVTIGTQTWMAENLKVTKYNDGTEIPYVVEDIAWQDLLTPSYSWYNHDPTTFKSIYGALYNGYSVTSERNGGKNICPTNWHVPRDDEWTILTTYLGGTAVSGRKLKETGITHWPSPNTAATDEFGFKALPGGNRNGVGIFVSIGSGCFFWSSTNTGTDTNWDRRLGQSDNVFSSRSNVADGFSVRCVKD